MRLQPFTLAPLCLAISVAAQAQTTTPKKPAEKKAEYAIEEVFITGVRENRTSKGATGLDLSLKETPQSISVISREFMNDFSTHNLNDALKLATGIQVEAWETNRTNYMSRGFEIKNTQIDGVGMPNSWGIVTGEMDTFTYEKLEVIRGANGLLTGVGNSSGTINYVRKRPTNEQEGSLGVSAGSFDFRRVQADYSTPFTESGEWAGRVVVAAEDKDSYLRGYENDRVFLYGVIDGQLTENSTLAAGYTHQKNESVGNMWGALILDYTDGTQAEFPRETSTAQDWTMWDTLNDSAFVEYIYNFSENWNTRLSYNYRETKNEDKLFYVIGAINKETGLGLTGWPGNWPDENKEDLLDLSINGKFELGGMEHQVLLGYSKGDSEYYSSQRPHAATEPAAGLLPPFPYDGDAIPEPVWGNKVLRSATFQKLERTYGAFKLNASENLAAIIGLQKSTYTRDGQSYGVPFDQTEEETSPYYGVTYDITDNLMVYASYSDIYQPQDQKDLNEQYLDPSKGENYEVGIRQEISDNLIVTLAHFTADQKDLGTYAGITSNGTYFYEGVDVYSKGTELEFVGQITEYDQFVLGLTTLDLEGENHKAIYKWVPRETINLAYSSQLPAYPAVRLGVAAKYQSDISRDNTVLKQSSYTTVNLFAAWDVTDNFNMQLNVNNVTDEKYLTSLYNVGYYSAPANFTIGANYQF
ncbi:MAG TPA: TonB-dependent siderophore receptor [Cellvibrio sp.]|nr:TonB-dependent siderophore receptor [Cellvibrio sp.]